MDQLRESEQNVSLVPGMSDLIRHLGSNPQNELVVLSDSVDELIKWVLEKHDLAKYFSHIYSNKFRVTKDQFGNTLCQIEDYTYQTNCGSCPANLCKRNVLSEILSAKLYDQVCYIGDGYNDICPCGILTPNDFAFVREGEFSFCRHIRTGLKLDCKTVLWQNGNDIKLTIDSMQ